MARAPFDTLAESSRVWIYRSHRPLSEQEVKITSDSLDQFLDSWTAHNVELLANAQVLHHQFIVITLDENSSSAASGCSIDAQVRFVRALGDSLKVDFFDRLTFDFLIDKDVQSIKKDEVQGLINQGSINDDALVFDHLVKTKNQFTHRWILPLNESWHYRLI
ncbi:MAG: ABC transporter ATPase [Bacteroidota bacterium]